MANDEMISLVHEEASDRMSKALQRTKAEFAAVRTGRASSSLLERIPVDYYGAIVPLQQLAGFTVPDSRTLMVNPFDKGSMGAIERAIIEANLGLNPSNDGHSIRLAFPPLTEERRKDLVRMVRAKAEEGRNGVRSARRETRKELEGLQKDGEISEDDLRRAEDSVDKLAKQFEEQIDHSLDAKTAELMEG